MLHVLVILEVCPPTHKQKKTYHTLNNHLFWRIGQCKIMFAIDKAASMRGDVHGGAATYILLGSLDVGQSPGAYGTYSIDTHIHVMMRFCARFAVQY